MRKQREQNEPKHREILRCRPYGTEGSPRDEVDGGLGLRVRIPSNSGNGDIQSLPTLDNRGLAVAAKLPHPTLALAISGNHRIRKCTLRRRYGWRDA
ncbi:hypothetical protein XF30_21085 [Bradyrhizobium sp. SUTN9-2]|uniref:hypothetical protein n=1 Tax=Bradyrhizobium sp. SUTN9-2 TaxID=1167456 RepID=UPI000D670611|nr:hypothetical protein [Bradyrhizobium sp. SUTN9-2]PWE78866.1 hypothetical protein XF30_21085 [Bradyrhizobium sp. SUTN9-2]